MPSVEHFLAVYFGEVKNEEFLLLAIIHTQPGRNFSIFCALLQIAFIKKEWRRNCSLWFPLINQALLSSTRSRSFFIYEHFAGVRNGWVSARRWKIFKFFSQTRRNVCEWMERLCGKFSHAHHFLPLERKIYFLSSTLATYCVPFSCIILLEISVQFIAQTNRHSSSYSCDSKFPILLLREKRTKNKSV